MRAEHLLSCANDLGEGPLWAAEEKALYWLDINRAIIQRYEPETGTVQTFHMPLRVTALGQRRVGGFVCASEGGFY